MAAEMAQWVKQLPSRHGDQSVNPRTSVKSRGVVETVDRSLGTPGQPSPLGEFQVSERLFLSKAKVDVTRGFDAGGIQCAHLGPCGNSAATGSQVAQMS